MCQTSTGYCIPNQQESNDSENVSHTDASEHMDSKGIEGNPEMPTDTVSSTCGNGKVDPGESCDGTDFQGKDCTQFGYEKGELTCRGCQIIPTSCVNKISQCGNGFVEPGEDCESNKLKGETCFTKGFSDGQLKCTDCQFDTSGCTGGKGNKTFGQLCEKDDDCQTGICTRFNVTDRQGYCGVTCSASKPCPGDAQCVFQVGQYQLCGWTCAAGGACPSGMNCIPYANNMFCGAGQGGSGATCGNNKVETGEACDGTDLNNKTCASFGYTGGNLKCKNNCTPDFSFCTGGAGKKKHGELCQSDTDCDPGLTCIRVKSTSSQGYCASSCVQGVNSCPASPPDADCILQTGQGSFCGWRCDDGSPCPSSLSCINLGSGSVCGPP